jgi:copper chaperone CopZ
METIALKIVGDNKMNCGGCERSVQAALMDINGVQSVKANHQTQDVEVVTTGGIIPETLTRELAEIGYQAQPA